MIRHRVWAGLDDGSGISTGVSYDFGDAIVGLVAGLDIQSYYYRYNNVRYSGCIYSVVQTDKKINKSIYSAPFLFASI